MRRNLYYFICPLREIWRWNVNRLKSFWPIFNGRKVISIVTGEGLENPDLVKRSFDDPDVEFITTENNWFLGETVSFIRGLELFYPEASDEITFYAHAKGVSHAEDKVDLVRRWADAMYVLNLSSIPLVESLMDRHNAMGCFRKKVKHGGASWHFSGTFFWFKNSALFARDWRDIEMSRFGTEGYPGRQFAEEETFDLTPDDPQRHLYMNPPDEETYHSWLRDLVAKEVSK